MHRSGSPYRYDAVTLDFPRLNRAQSSQAYHALQQDLDDKRMSAL
jgi:hypothetical protein